MAETHPSAVHHRTAAEHSRKAADSHEKAAQHYEKGEHEIATHYAYLAQGHHVHATEHGNEASKKNMIHSLLKKV